MKKTVAISMLALVFSFEAAAHPTGIPYSTRGECEAAYAGFSKFDRNRLDQLPDVTKGDAQRTFRDLFACEYDANADAWFIVMIGEMPG